MVVNDPKYDCDTCKSKETCNYYFGKKQGWCYRWVLDRTKKERLKKDKQCSNYSFVSDRTKK